MKQEKVIFFGNGPLAEYALAVIERECQVVFHARTKEDLARAVEFKQKYPEAHGILASYGVMVPSAVLKAFEPEGILNIHPSLLPLNRGASPIESAILAGDREFGVSVMKLVRAMDAGPLYHQMNITDIIFDKDWLYRHLAEAGAEWIVANLAKLPEPTPQEGEPTFCGKFEKKDGVLNPKTDSAEMIYRKIVAFQGFPKPKYAFYGVPCTILEAHLPEQGEKALLTIPCADGRAVVVTRLQPDGRKAMNAKSFINGYAR